MTSTEDETAGTELAGWTVRAVGGDVPEELAGVSVPAAVPGCVHLDLLAAGLIPDPYLARKAAPRTPYFPNDRKDDTNAASHRL